MPKGSRRNWSSLEAFNKMTRVLQQKILETSGFTHFCMPNIEWMLRVIVWADPSLKEEIINAQVKNYKDERDKLIEQEDIQIDPL